MRKQEWIGRFCQLAGVQAVLKESPEDVPLLTASSANRVSLPVDGDPASVKPATAGPG